MNGTIRPSFVSLFNRCTEIPRNSAASFEKKNWDLFYQKLKYFHIPLLKSLQINCAPFQPIPVSKWKCAGNSKWKKIQIDPERAFSSDGNYEITFTQLKGVNTLFRNITVLYDRYPTVTNKSETIIYKDVLEPIHYTVTLPNRYSYSKQLSFELSCDEDSEGEVFIDSSFETGKKADFYDIN